MALDKLVNPSNRPEQAAAERKRIPMSVPVQRLEAPDIPGYHLHWFTSSPERLSRAVDGGYEFVDEKECGINNTSLGGTSTRTGNTDMGSRVSIVSGQELGKDGQPMRLVLMKIKLEWYEEDQKLVEGRNQKVVNTLLGGMATGAGDTSHRYVDQARTQIPDFFKPKRPKAA